MQIKRKTTSLILIPLAALVMGACSGDSGSTPAAGGAEAGTEVALRNIMFQPGDVTISTGEAITWNNEDDVDHTVTSGVPQEQGVPGVSDNTEAQPDGTFDQMLSSGDDFSFTFEEAGTYDYFCGIHPGMTASITVE